ncbi:succinyl-CoA synthetase, beta subunit [Thermodesulfobium narugense DSM 14796]|uniref:Succinyl-CoA synthetase, beta subunit n=1 Tax=Thermodesulfobium narugense DSM 14796 TaxID=747365 RepID=M1E8X3_9BACT|nr:ADP-forming succinate--CoA ligase subunit beta [Thermodesulfobium narugense]AEE14714.1 succinyl-CoA synthetase, beta subunit [Thermodesulfobium narugense DSM 14796]
MRLFEYQAKSILSEYLNVPKGVIIDKENVDQVVTKLNFPCVLKAQVKVGGRGKAGGVLKVKDSNELKNALEKLFSMEIKGEKVNRILAEELIDIDRELYFSVIFYRPSRRYMMVFCKEGGVDIEQLAEAKPDAINKVKVDPIIGIKDFMIRNLIKDFELYNILNQFVKSAYKIFVEKDLVMLEINPLVITKNKEVICADAKVEFDDNALYKHPEFEAFLEQSEIEARKLGFSFVPLEGDIGILGNGAGLVLATIDSVTRAGGKCANFLDIGGGAKAERVKSALKFLVEQKKLKGILINVFGGITRADEVAKGLLEFEEEQKLNLPVVVRLSGTKAEEGLEMLKERFEIVSSLRDGAKKIVELVNQ